MQVMLLGASILFLCLLFFAFCRKQNICDICEEEYYNEKQVIIFQNSLNNANTYIFALKFVLLLKSAMYFALLNISCGCLVIFFINPIAITFCDVAVGIQVVGRESVSGPENSETYCCLTTWFPTWQNVEYVFVKSAGSKITFMGDFSPGLRWQLPWGAGMIISLPFRSMSKLRKWQYMSVWQVLSISTVFRSTISRYLERYVKSLHTFFSSLKHGIFFLL